MVLVPESVVGGCEAFQLDGNLFIAPDAEEEEGGSVGVGRRSSSDRPVRRKSSRVRSVWMSAASASDGDWRRGGGGREEGREDLQQSGWVEQVGHCC